MKAVASLATEVHAFHARWNQLPVSAERYSEIIRDRLQLLTEEVDELKQAADVKDASAICEEAADVLFVAIGNLHRLGAGGAQAMAMVAAKNRAKTNTSHYVHPQTGKITRRSRLKER